MPMARAAAIVIPVCPSTGAANTSLSATADVDIGDGGDVGRR